VPGIGTQVKAGRTPRRIHRLRCCGAIGSNKGTSSQTFFHVFSTWKGARQPADFGWGDWREWGIGLLPYLDESPSIHQAPPGREAPREKQGLNHQQYQHEHQRKPQSAGQRLASSVMKLQRGNQGHRHQGWSGSYRPLPGRGFPAHQTTAQDAAASQRWRSGTGGAAIPIGPVHR